MKQKFIEFGMKVAEAAAEMSYGRRLKVGSVLMKNNRIVSCGYNGTGTGEDNCCEHEYAFPADGVSLKTKDNVRHAEWNAIMPLLRTGQSTDGMEMLVTHAPCKPCSMLIIDAGIKTVYYKHDYRDPVGLDYLRENGIAVIKL